MTHDTDTVHTPESYHGESQDSLVICGGAELNITAAPELYGSLLRALQARQSVVFDMAQVECVDTAILQMLCAFVRDAQAMGLPVHWQQLSPAIRNAAQLLHVEACLALPATA